MSYLFNDKRFEANQTNYALRTPSQLGSDVGILSGFSPTNAFKTTVEGLHQGIVNEPLTALSLAASSVIDVAAHALKVKYHIDRPDLVQSIKDSWFKHTTEPLIKDRIQSMPDPKTNGIAIQVLHSLASIGGQAATMGAAATGVSSGIGEAATMVQQGKDAGTALKVGTIRGATNAVGVKIPAAIGSNLAQRVASGAAGNVAIGAASDAAINTVDSTIGARFDDPTNRTIDLVLGVAFGSLAHVQAKANVKTDAINTEQSNVKTIDKQSNTQGITEKYNTVIKDNTITEGEYIDALSMAENKLSIGELKKLKYEKNDLEYKLKYIEQPRKQDFIDIVNNKTESGRRKKARHIASEAEKLAEQYHSESVENIKDKIKRIDDIILKNKEYKKAFSTIESVRQGITKIQSDSALVANNSRKVNNTSEPERLYKAIDDLTIPKENNNAERTIDNTEPVSDTRIIPDSERTTTANHGDGERANQFTTPEIEAASEIIQKDNSMEIAVEDDDGNIVIKPAAELADEINADIEFASKSDSLIKTAITCFLK